jgi:aspartyl-tRNA(Asn)/glutamyl-tRNA(Gln) amidotransferase subunit A
MRVGVIRHFWEEDAPATDEVRQAMDTALGVLSDLGAKLDVVRMRPLKDYYDVAKTIGLPELMAVHLTDLIERPGDFSAAFRSRGALAGCLFQASDYVEAQRERSLMLAEMKPLYQKFDVLLTAGSSGPAPRLDKYRIVSYWKRPNITTPFSITGGPALVLCNGFSQSGMPFGMQIAGRPFDEEKVLRVSYAYEQATHWHTRRPTLVAGPAPMPVSIDSGFPATPAIDEGTRELLERLAQRAGLALTESQFAELCHAAPYAFAMVERIRRRRDHSENPATVFRFGN